jgi:hypothetical protein
MKTAFLVLFIVALVVVVVDGLTGRRLDWRAGVPITAVLLVGFLMLSDAF